MRTANLPLTVAVFAAILGAAGCAGVTSHLRFGPDGQAEYFIECDGVPMGRCYDKALELCPQGYFLVKEDQRPGGTKSGGMFGRTKHVGGESGSTQVVWKNQVVVRCKAVGAPGGPEGPGIH